MGEHYEPKHRSDRHEDSCGLACDAGFGGVSCDQYRGRRRSVCSHMVGPIPKLGGQVLVCHLAAGHAGDHYSADGAWWIREEDGLHDHYALDEGRAS